MPGDRVLWTGPYGSATRDHALAAALVDPSSLWLSASPMARDQVRRELAVRSRSDETDRDAGQIPRVWCWAELWARVRDGSREGPSCLSEAAAGAVFGQAIRQARHAGEVDAIAAVIDWAGYRRRLRRRFAEWTAEERPLRSRPPADPASVAEWAAFVRYRVLLRQLGAEDETGLAVWASRRLLQRPPASLSRSPRSRSSTGNRRRRPNGGCSTTPARADRSASRWRARMARVRPPSTRPRSPARARLLRARVRRDRRPARDLAAVGTARARAGPVPPLAEAGAAVPARPACRSRGAAGEGRPACSPARPRPARPGRRPRGDPRPVPPLGGTGGGHAGILRQLGHPVHAEPTRPLGAEPSVAVLLLAIGLPVEDWATDRVIRLLRNGQVRPGWPGSEPLSMAAAASVVKVSPVFRGREQLLNWLDRRVAEQQGHTVEAERARLARDLVERIFAILAPLDEPRPFAEQVEQLFRVATELGIGRAGAIENEDTDNGAAGLDRLRDAMEDQAGVLECLGRGESRWSWAAFAAEVESSAMEWTAPPAPPAPGSVRVATVDEAVGASAQPMRSWPTWPRGHSPHATPSRRS